VTRSQAYSVVLAEAILLGIIGSAWACGGRAVAVDASTTELLTLWTDCTDVWQWRMVFLQREWRFVILLRWRPRAVPAISVGAGRNVAVIAGRSVRHALNLAWIFQ